jgi:hypothetical protein
MKYCHYLLAFFVLTLPQDLLSSYYYSGETNPALKKKPDQRRIDRARKGERRRKFPKSRRAKEQKPRAANPCTGRANFHRSSRKLESHRELITTRRSQTSLKKTNAALGLVETLAKKQQIFETEILQIY